MAKLCYYYHFKFCYYWTSFHNFFSQFVFNALATTCNLVLHGRVSEYCSHCIILNFQAYDIQPFAMFSAATWLATRDVREWLSTFSFPPIPILSMLKLYIISDTVIIIINRNPNHLLWTHAQRCVHVIFCRCFFYRFFFFMAALVGQTAERIFTKLPHVVDIRCYLQTY